MKQELEIPIAFALRTQSSLLGEMGNYTDENTVNDVIDILQKHFGAKEMVDHTYNLAKRFYSYANLRRKLRFILTDFFGEEIGTKH